MSSDWFGCMHHEGCDELHIDSFRQYLLGQYLRTEDCDNLLHNIKAKILAERNCIQWRPATLPIWQISNNGSFLHTRFCFEELNSLQGTFVTQQHQTITWQGCKQGWYIQWTEWDTSLSWCVVRDMNIEYCEHFMHSLMLCSCNISRIQSCVMCERYISTEQLVGNEQKCQINSYQ